MRRAGPPQPVAPQPAPRSKLRPPRATGQQQAQARPATPPPPPPPQQSLLNEPKPAPTAPARPSFDTGPQTAGDAIRQAERNAAQAGAPSGDYGQNAPSQHPAMGAGADILSDTMGVDFGPYMKRVIAATYRSWIPIIPESARPPLDKQGRVGVRFKIYPDGSVKEMILEFPSGDVSLDRAAWGGITGAAPISATSKRLQRKIPGAALRLLLQPDPDKIR